MRPFEGFHTPLAKIEQADHAHDVQRLHSDEAGDDADQTVPPRRGEGEHRGDENDRGLNAVTSRLNGKRETVAGTLKNLAKNGDLGIE